MMLLFTFIVCIITTSGQLASRDDKLTKIGRSPKAAGHDSSELAHQFEDTTIADELAKRVRVLCLVMTHPATHETRAKHVKATWGKRCNVLLFISTQYDRNLPTVALTEIPDGPEYLWPKTKAAFKYIHKHHRHDAEWFLRADDDTYVIPENLRWLLSEYSRSEPLYLGCRFKYVNDKSYMYGGASYVLSREALDLFANEIGVYKRNCLPDYGETDDIEMGLCLQQLGIKAIDTRDKYNRGRFFPDNIEHHLFPTNKQSWYWDRSFYPLEAEGVAQVSDYAISFHFVKSDQMYVLDYFLYHVRAFGNIKQQFSIEEKRRGNLSTSSLILA